MRRRIILLLLAFTIFFFLGSLQNLAETERPAQLEVFDVQPSPAGLLSPDQAITFTFNRRVDCTEAESAFAWQPAIRGRLTCDEYSLTFEPLDQYQRDTSYSFAFSPPLQAKDGAPLFDPFRVTFWSAGYLEVAEAFPQPESKSVPVDSVITVVFDRPVVPLLASVSEDELPHPLVLLPATVGSGEWVNSAVYVFRPAEPLDSEAEYTALVATDLKAVDGSTIASAFRWSFNTAAPSIVSVHPRPTSRRYTRDRWDDITLNPKIQVRFNQAMDRAAVERAFYFRAGLESDALDIAGEFEWAEDGKGFVFTPDARLWYDTEYETGFPARLYRSLSGHSWSYRTVRRPAIERTYPTDSAIDVGSGGFSLHFASRMNIDTLRERIQIDPKPEAITRDFYSRFDDRYDIHFRARPSTQYTVRIEPGMEDIYGNAISEPLNFEFTTGPLPPRVEMKTPGPVGFYNANRHPTQLYITHRGVDKVNLELYHVPTKEFIRHLAGGSRRDADDEQASQRSLLQRWSIESEVGKNRSNYELLQLGENGPIASDADQSLARGVYLLKALSPELEEWKREQWHFLNVSNAVLTLKLAPDRLTIWALDIDSGAPIIGESISVYDQLGEYLGDAVTDEQGIAQLHIWYEPGILFTGLSAVLDSDQYFGIGYSRWSPGMGRWDANRPEHYALPAYQTYFYVDRPVYRPGQPVYFRGIVRRKDDVVYLPPPFETVQATLRNWYQGDVVEKHVLNVSEFGAFHGEFEIPTDATLGYYSISIDFPKNDGEFGRNSSRNRDFLVAEYRLPEYQLSLATEESELMQGETSTVEIEGKYFFGGPVSDAVAEYTVYAQPYSFNYTGDGYYHFSDSGSYRGWYERVDHDDVVAEGSLMTDAAGVARLDLVGELADGESSKRWRVEASIRDEAGQAITDTADLIVHQGLLYVGARPDRYVSRVGQDSVINIIAVDWDSQPIAGQDIDVQVVERRWTRTQKQDLETGGIKTTWDVEEIPVTSGSVTTGANGKARFVFQPPNGGSFNIIVSTQDEQGNRVSATTRAWVSSRTYVRWRNDDDKTIELVADKQEHRVGDKAQVLIASPFQAAAQALISIERGDVLSVELVTLESNSHIHEFEILPEHAPNVFVNVFLIKPADERNSVADWRMGRTQLQVDPERYALSIEINAEPEPAEPQSEVTFSLRVSDWKGAPVVAEVGLALTDLAALSLGERKIAPLLETFFGR